MNVALNILEKRALGRLKHDKRKTLSDNPYNHVVPVTNSRGKTKYVTEKRPPPEGISKHDAKILKKVRKRAYRWDMGWGCCCGIRWGLSSLIGLIPVVGDFIDVAMAYWLIRTASKIEGGLPKKLWRMMVFNVVLDLGLGIVPFVGDIADLFYRANTRNAWLLDAFLEEKGAAILEEKRAAILAKKIVDPEGGGAVQLPAQLQVAPEDRDVEQGVEDEKAVVGPTPVAPAFTPGARTPAARGKDLPPPYQQGVPQGRNLTGQQTPGRPRQDPRDYPRR